jgi:hypothetical protein
MEKSEIRDPSPPPDGSSDSAPWFRRVTLFSVLAGLCPLVPIPFLDDKVLSWVRRKMIRDLLGARGLHPSEQQVRILEGEAEGGLRGCLGAAVLWPLLKLAVYLVKKVVKKIILILTLKECVDRLSETLHEGYLLHRAAERWQGGGRQGPRRVRAAVERACDAVDPRPVHQLVKKLLRGSRLLLLRASKALTKLARKERREQLAQGDGEKDPDLDLSAEESLLGSLADSLSSSLWTQKAYWRDLEEHFDAALALQEAPGPTPKRSGTGGEGTSASDQVGLAE